MSPRTDSRATSTSDPPEPGPAMPRFARAPVDVPTVVLVAVLLCVALVGLGLVALRDALVGRTLDSRVLVPGDAWLPYLLERSTLVPGDAVVVGGVGAAVLGLTLVVVAFLPRPPRTLLLRVTAPGGGPGLPVHVERPAVADLAADAALDVSEVDSSRAVVRRRRVAVHVTVDPRDPHDARVIADAVAERVRDRLRDLRPTPVVRVRVHGVMAT